MDRQDSNDNKMKLSELKQSKIGGKDPSQPYKVGSGAPVTGQAKTKQQPPAHGKGLFSD